MNQPRHTLPRHTLRDLSFGSFDFEEPPGFRRIARSIFEIALLTGVVLRIYRAIVLSFGANAGWPYAAFTFMLGALIFFSLATIHIGNFPLKQWMWRAPAFGAIEAAGEMITSLLLIWLGREPVGSVRAEMSDWPSMAATTLLWRITAITVFALLLASVVQFVRRKRLSEERIRNPGPPPGFTDRRRH